jgi:hypothetical protein
MKKLSTALLTLLALLATFASPSVATTPFTVWSNATTYAVGDVVEGSISDYNLYRSVTAGNLNNDPESDTGTHWILDKLNSPTTLTCGSGMRFPGTVDDPAGINAALGFASQALSPVSSTFAPGATFLTLQVADGTYNYGSHSIVLNGPPTMIEIIGDELSPSSCTLTYSGTGTFIEMNKLSGAAISGFTITGPGTSQGIGMLVGDENSVLVFGKINLSYFQYGLYAAIDGTLRYGTVDGTLPSNATVSHCYYGVVASGLATANIPQFTLGGYTSTLTISSCTWGVVAEDLSRIWMTGDAFSGNTTNKYVDGTSTVDGP